MTQFSDKLYNRTSYDKGLLIPCYEKDLANEKCTKHPWHISKPQQSASAASWKPLLIHYTLHDPWTMNTHCMIPEQYTCCMIPEQWTWQQQRLKWLHGIFNLQCFRKDQWILYTYCMSDTRFRSYKTIFMLNSAKTIFMLNSADPENFSADIYENANSSWHFHYKQRKFHTCTQLEAARKQLYLSVISY